MSEQVFVLDANVFIEAERRYYAFDLAPKFWNSLIQHAETGQIRTIDRIQWELERGKDQLSDWVKRDFSRGIESTNEDDVIESYRSVMTWVQGQAQFSSAAKADFARGADGWLVAYSSERKCVIVTHEVFAPDAKRKVHIPNVCQQFNIQFVDTFEMLRRLGVRFN